MNKEQTYRLIILGIILTVFLVSFGDAPILNYNFIFSALLVFVVLVMVILFEAYLKIQHNVDKQAGKIDNAVKVIEDRIKLVDATVNGKVNKIDESITESVRQFFIMKNDSAFKLLVLKSGLEKQLDEIKKDLEIIKKRQEDLDSGVKKINLAKSNNLRAFWFRSNNLGDRISPIILEYFLSKKVEFVDAGQKEKLLGVGSIINALKEGDVVWGAGSIDGAKITAPRDIKFLAVRGPLTRDIISGANVPEIYGDPGILLPLIYNPKIEKRHKVGILPHYIDKCLWEGKVLQEGEIFIDVEGYWKKVIEEILSCELIRTSSLHGVILAQAYGVPVIWERYSDNIIGEEFKFQDYFLGTGQGRQVCGRQLPELHSLEEKQKVLIRALESHYKII